MNRKEIQKISLQYRTLSSQMLKMNSQEEMYCIQQFFDFISETEIIRNYINECKTQEYDFEQIFVRKSIEPFVVAIRTYIELCFIDCEDVAENQENKVVTIFLSYCQKDMDIADCLEENIAPYICDKAKISRDIRDVEYHESFKRFMQSIEKHDYVITIISDNYLKSRNCMFEMLEVVKDSYFSKKLLFIVLGDDDAKYYKNIPQEGISADVYSALGQAKYSKYWSSVDKELEIEIEEIGDPMHAILQIKEKQIVQKILLDMPEFLEFIRDNKGLTLSEHIEKGFEDMISFMGL